MIVYGTSISPFVRKVLFFLGEKGLAAEHVPLRFHDPDPGFQAASLLGKIPAFSDGDVRLCDSSAICHYIEKAHPEPALLPSDPRGFAQAIWFDKFHDTMLQPAIVKIFFQLFFRVRVLKQDPDMAVVEAALKTDIPRVYDVLDGFIDGPFLVGDAISLADIAIACPFVNAKMAGHPVDAARWPRLGAYIAAIHARPAFAAISDKPKVAAA